MTWKARVVAVACAQRGCASPPSDDHCLCPAHRLDHNRRQRASKRQRQRAREAQGSLSTLGEGWTRE